MVFESDEPVLQRDDRRRKLEGRARRIASLNRLVDQWPTLVLEELLVIVRRNSARELVGVPAWRAVQSEDFTGVRVDRDRSALQRICEDANGELLQIQIDIRVEGRRTFRVEIRPRTLATNGSAARIDLVEANAFLTVQNPLVLFLESGFADFLARLVVGVLGIVE